MSADLVKAMPISGIFTPVGFYVFIAFVLLVVLTVVTSRRIGDSTRSKQNKSSKSDHDWTDDIVLISLAVAAVCFAGAVGMLFYGWATPCSEWVPHSMLDSRCGFDPGRTRPHILGETVWVKVG